MGHITDEAIQITKDQGFKLLLTSGIDLESSKIAVHIAEKYDIVKACVGVHPWYANEYSRNVEAELMKLANNNEVVAISEIGLDFVGRMTKEWIREDRFIDPEIQLRTLQSQLNLAKEFGLPAIIHDRAPDEQLLDILLKSGNIDLAIHGFNKGQTIADKCIENEILLSIGLRTIENYKEEYLETIKKISLDYFLTETDSSKPEGVLRVCEVIGSLKEVSRESVGIATTKNLMRLCHI